ncbi:MAG: hypothetical protein EZS28_025974 [Streblomastix strix]|uniref:Uncharacterized protein n=1 Tax=Streblomastix strix TaxID=222440 RepID=A0A5J4V775_9EUKA|nr:MAG: hypothetical protein EZS28_025974 [Streblomastix strix]
MRDIEEVTKDQVSIPYAMPIRFRLSIPLENSIISMAKYYTMNKTDLIASGPDKLKNIDLLFRDWTDLITTTNFEQITNSRLKNLMCSISPVILTIKNYVVIELTANMSGYVATYDCQYRVRDFCANRPFVVPTQRVETWSFLTSATTVGIRTSQKISLSHVTDLCLLFPKEA